VYTEVLYEVDDPVATVTLNRPAALNAITATMSAEIRAAVTEAQHDPAVVGIIITGAGRGFSAGADMNTLVNLRQPGSTAADSMSNPDDDSDPESVAGDFRGLYTFLLSVPKPVIAAINGPVAGMSIALAMSCDLRFMAREASFLTAFSQRGVVAEWGLSWLLPRLVGPAVALDLLFSSRKIDGAECERLGLVNQAVAADELMAEARAYIVDLAARCSPTSLAFMKRQVYEQLHAGLGAAEREAEQLMRESFTRPDFTEGVQSFLEKRPPQFGRL
jgi:enoyl-CoA hydratase/carnithine racemase